MRAMLKNAVEKMRLMFIYVLADSWFASSDNMLFTCASRSASIHKLKKFFVMDTCTTYEVRV